MAREKNINAYRREVASRLRKLAECGPLIDGSLVVIRRRCGNPNCRCARGHKHPAHYLTRKVGRRFTTEKLRKGHRSQHSANSASNSSG